MVKFLEDTIMVELKKFNFKRNSLGYEYLIDAIKIIIRDQGALRNFYDYVYVPIAEKYRTKPENILWCMNKIVSLMYFNTDYEIISEYFELDSNEKLSTKEFILRISKKIMEKDRNN